MANIEQLVLPYPDFILGQTIDPEEFDQNNTEIVNKINETIDVVNVFNTTINGISVKADEAVETAETADDKANTTLASVVLANTNASNALNIANIANQNATIAIQASIGSTVIKNELYIIVNANVGDGTFTYKDSDENIYSGTRGSGGEQTFTLLSGTYPLEENRIEIIKNNTTIYTSISGAISEVDATHVTLNTPASNNDFVNIKYFEKIGLGGEHCLTHEVGQSDEIGGLIYINSVQPSSEKAIWYKEI